MKSLWEIAAAETWAMDEAHLQTVLAIAGREHDGPEAVEALRGAPLMNSQTVTVRDGVAVLPVTGPMFRYANLMTRVSGASSYQVLATDFRTAMDDPQVKAVMLALDTPGGMVNGANEVAKMIRAARDGGTKPVVAYVSGTAASAGYWLASAAGRIFVDDTAHLGSIGVILTTTADKTKDRIEIVSSQSPLKRVDAAADEGRAVLQARVDELAQIFIATVAANRGVSPETVAQDFGRGGELIGAAAVAAGMADGIGSHEEILAGLASGRIGARGRTVPPRLIATTKGQTMEPETVESIAAAHPEIATALRKEGEATGEKAGHAAGYEAGRMAGLAEGEKAGLVAGATAERERIAALEGAALPGFEKLLAEHKADGGKTEVDLLRAQTAAQKEQGADWLKQRAAGEAALKDLPAAGATAPGGQGKADPNRPPKGLAGDGLKDWAQKQWDGDEAIRREFKDFGAYHGHVALEAKRTA